MKQLIINGRLAVIDADQYFPFTYRISDLEEVNIINFPSTKSFMLPRNTQNDELFGHIAEITRLNYGYVDNKVGVSFNQFKKATYELLSDSQLISSGLVRIVNITNDSYEIELYDVAIEILEDLEDKELNDLFIYSPYTQSPLNVRVNREVVADMLTNDYGIMPIFGNYDSNHTSNQIYGLKPGTYGNTPAILELPSELTPLQLKTFPAGDMPYAMKLNDAFDMVERGNKVVFTPDVRAYTNYIYMLLNKPKNLLFTEEETLKKESYYRELSGDTATGRFMEQYFVPIKNTNSTTKVFRNGNYVFNNEFEFIFKTNEPRSSGIWTQYLSTNWNNQSADGSTIGVMHLTSDIYLTVDGVETLITTNKTEIIMIKGSNTTFRQVGDKEELKIAGTYVLNSNIYPRSINGGTIRIRNKFENFSIKSNGVFVVTYPFNLKSGFSFTSNITPKIVLKPLDFTEYDLITSEKLLPKISVKDFVLDITKTFGFNIETRNGSLVVDTNKYRVTDEVIALDDEVDIDVSKVNFSRLKIMSGVSDSEILKEYEEKYGEYGAQIINTGYSIKKEEKEVELPYSVPLALIDYDYFAYDQFDAYLNGGYNRFPTGDIRGLDDGLILGYLQTNKDEMYITDTEVSEVTEFKPMLSNSMLIYDSSAPVRWKFDDEDVGTNLIKVDRYPTFMPYRVVNGVVVESLEVNKPLFNYGGLSDAEYPADTTLYHRFHRRMLTDKYSADTHILTAKMLLNGLAGIHNIYNHKNSNYIISELTEYDPTERDLYEVKLMRVNDTKNYTTAPALPPATPVLYTNLFGYTINSYFTGDVRAYSDKLKGFNSKVLVSINDGSFTTAINAVSNDPIFTYANGETRMRSSFQFVGNWDANNLYKVKTEQSMNYLTNTSPKTLAIADSPITTLQASNTSNNNWMTDNNLQTLTLSTIGGVYLTTPIYIRDFRKTAIFRSGNYYNITAQFQLYNGTTELNNATIEAIGLDVSGMGITGGTPSSVLINTVDVSGGIEVTMDITVFVHSPQQSPNLNDIAVRLLSDSGYAVSIKPYNTVGVEIKAGIQGVVEAVASPALFLSREFNHYTGNNIPGSQTVQYKRTTLSYTNTINFK